MYRLINATVIKPGASTNAFATAASMTPGTGAAAEADDTMMPLVTITQEDIDTYGIRDVQPQEGLVTLAEMMEKGIYQVRREVGDNLGYIAYADFVRDPEAFPRNSESGKIELYCQAKADIFPKLGWQDEKDPVKPYANYLRPLYGFEDTFADWGAKEKGAYPIQVFNGHYLRRSHSSFDSNSYLREAFANPVFMSAADAAERGIETGDWVRIFNDAGSIVRQASEVETMMPGVANTMHGSWIEMDETGTSINGGTNVLIDSTTSAGAQQGYNTRICQIEKYEVQDILPDAERPVVLPRGIED